MKAFESGANSLNFNENSVNLSEKSVNFLGENSRQNSAPQNQKIHAENQGENSVNFEKNSQIFTQNSVNLNENSQNAAPQSVNFQENSKNSPQSANSQENLQNSTPTKPPTTSQNPKNSAFLTPKTATLIASICAFFLALLKFAVGLMSGSVAVLSSALDSLMDFVISVLNFFALKKSAAQGNAHYNFGYDKLEALMGLLEALFIGAMAAFIFYEGASKLYKNEGVADLAASLAVMGFAMFASLALTLFLSAVAKRTKSLIVEADSLHYRTDFLTNFAAAAALCAIYFTGWGFIDGLFGIAISFYILFSAAQIAKKSVQMLLDRALDEARLARIEALINANSEVISFHELKTRVSPTTNYISVHLVFCPLISLMQAHAISDEIEAQIKAELGGKCSIQIHLDPYDDSISKDAQ